MVGVSSLRSVARSIKRQFSYAPLVLLYHRIDELSLDPQLLSVTPEHFNQHLEVIRRKGWPMALRDMVQALQRNEKLPRKAVAVTFDDGYADNVVNAKPLLERYGVPSTVYVTSGYVGTSREFLADQLESLFLLPGTLPLNLKLTIRGDVYEWDLGKDGSYSEEAYQSNRHWHVESSDTPTARHKVYLALCQLLYALPSVEQRSILDGLLHWAGRTPHGRSTHRAMTASEIAVLARNGLVDVGSHTVEHPSLASLSPDDQRREIVRSKADLEAIVERAVTSFAYPFGTRADYTVETVKIVREAGYTNACSNFPGLLLGGTDPWQLPRLLVRDWDGEEFHHRLVQWWGMD